MGLMSDEILGGGSDDEFDLRTTLKLKNKRLNGTTNKSYLGNAKGKKIQSDQRRDQIKSSLFSALDKDDLSYSVHSEADSGESLASIRLLHKRSNSLDSPAVGKKDQSQPKLRGKKSTILSADSDTPPPPPPSSKKSPRAGIRSLPMRSQSMGYGSKRPTGEKGMALPTGSDHREKGLSSSERSTAAAPRRRRVEESIKEEYPAIREDGQKRTVKRSVSLCQPKRRPNESEPSTDAPRRESLIPGRKPKGKQVGLGSYLSENTAPQRPTQRRTQDDSDSDGEDNNTVASSQSWISWAAASALKPLEKLYDDMNGVGEKRPKGDDSDSSDEDEYPNTGAEAYSTKLSTTDKIAGLRFVASKQRRQSLYV